MHARTAITAAAALAALLLTGCATTSTDEPDAKPKTTTTKPSPPPTPKTLTLGDIANINIGDKLTATALAFKDEGINGGPGLLHTGQKWAIVEAKVCNKGTKAIVISAFVWSLAYADGARVEPTHVSGGELPPPLYPMEAQVRGDDCVRGNITFEVPKDGGRPERVLYSPGGLDEPVEWAVPAK